MHLILPPPCDAGKMYFPTPIKYEETLRNLLKIKSPYFVKGFDDLKQMADSLQIPLYIYLHAEQGELKRQCYNEMGQQIVLWADSAQVTLINGIKEGERIDMYHDIIHFNEKGQRHLADVMKKYVKP